MKTIHIDNIFTDINDKILIDFYGNCHVKTVEATFELNRSNNFTIQTQNHNQINILDLTNKIKKIQNRIPKKLKEYLPIIEINNITNMGSISENNGEIRITLSQEIFNISIEEIIFIISHELAHLYCVIEKKEQKRDMIISGLRNLPSIFFVTLFSCINFANFYFLKDIKLILRTSAINQNIGFFILSFVVGYSSYLIYKFIKKVIYKMIENLNHATEHDADIYGTFFISSTKGAIKYFNRNNHPRSHTHPSSIERIDAIKGFSYQIKKVIYNIFKK